jgi:MYXO-CTERM domain-containing protein
MREAGRRFSPNALLPEDCSNTTDLVVHAVSAHVARWHQACGFAPTSGPLPQRPDQPPQDGTLARNQEERKIKNMKALKSRLSCHFAACAAAAAATVAAPQQADAAIVYSGVMNLNVPATFDGLYLNFVTGATGSSGGSTAGWDIDPWVSGGNWLFFTNGNGANPDGGVVGAGGAVSNLATGTMISGASSFLTGSTPNLTTNFAGQTGFIGVRFVNEANANQIHFGWVHMTVGATGGTASTIIDWAYESQAGVGIAAGAGIPAPGALALLGLAGLVGSRRRRA